jgi:hypothetical protein
VLAGTVTETEALPPEHETVWGSSERAGEEENTQLVVEVTEAKSCTDPPAWGRAVGVAVNEVILGEDFAGSARCRGCVTVLGVVRPGAAEATGGDTAAIPPVTSRPATAAIVRRRHIDLHPRPPLIRTPAIPPDDRLSDRRPGASRRRPVAQTIEPRQEEFLWPTIQELVGSRERERLGRRRTP